MSRRRTREEQEAENDGPDLDDQDQHRGEEFQAHQPRLKRRELQEALHDIQEELLATEERLEEMQRIAQEREAEIERLKAANTQPGVNAGQTNNRPRATAGLAAKKGSEDEARAVRTAGRRCCVLHLPWMQGDSLFDTDFREGMRKMRSEAVSAVANNRHIVFGLSDDEFGDRHNQRARLAGAQALYEGNAYMWAPDDPDDPKTDYERFLRGKVTLNAAKLILQGNSSVKSDKRSALAGSSRAEMWHVKAVIPSIISFITIVIHFVLSGDTSFEMVAPSGNHMDIYEANLRLLGAHKRKYPRAHRALLKLYNKTVLPQIHSIQPPVDEEFVGMSAAGKDFYLRMTQEGGGEEADAEGEGDAN
ncbi:hypothetical protein FRC06_003206 [Ceratobasidium sp. 370]|nr:hypothetical protein FRC06_003206 [Ceratobasidium sp. 370]